MKLPNINKTEQALICVFVFLTFVTVLYRFSIVPELNRVKAARFQLGFQQDLLEMKSAEAQNRNALINSVQKLRAEMAQTRDSLFSKDEATVFLKSLFQLVRQTGNALITITPYDIQAILPADEVKRGSKKKRRAEEAEGHRSFMTMPVKITISGDYNEVIGFLEQLQEHKQLITVSKLKIATGQDPSMVDAELMLNLYVYENQEV